VGILRYPVTVMGKIRQQTATGLEPGKADGKAPLSQETLVYIASVGGGRSRRDLRSHRDLYHFRGFGDWALREESVILRSFFPPQGKRLN